MHISAERCIRDMVGPISIEDDCPSLVLGCPVTAGDVLSAQLTPDETVRDYRPDLARMCIRQQQLRGTDRQ
jgi:hypothetical protein